MPIYRSIAIPLNDKFRYVHDTYDKTQSPHLFVGRKLIIEKLVSLLKNEHRRRGSYLIAGYRGVGKTSFINKALDQYSEENEKEGKKKHLVVRINLGDSSQLTPLNIYFSITNILREEISESSGSFLKKFFIPAISLQNTAILFSLLVLIIGILGLFNQTPEQNILNIYENEEIGWWLLILLSLPTIIWGSLRWLNPKFEILDEIDELIERMSNEISEARSAGINHHQLSLSWSKRKTKLPINAREAEDQLSRILKQLNNKKIKVIIVLDEIDKLSDHEELSEIHYNNNSSTGENDKIDRINTLLGLLKNFFTTAQATFFFISGRETLDRYYSEKGSPNSLYESLFDQVFEVPSLLTDEGKNYKGTQLSLLIEEYVCQRINKIDKADRYILRNLYDDLLRSRILEIDANIQENRLKAGQRTKEIEKAASEIRSYISFLRSFIHFLTFHSWGNPRRLNTIFESFIVPRISVSFEESGGYGRYKLLMKQLGRLLPANVLRVFGSDKSHGSIRSNEIEVLDIRNHQAEYWLLFNNSDKRSFSLTSEITTLYQHQLSREVSRISDKLAVSVFSSLHFILKLHSYGFSREALHRMSETINIYRSPELNTIVDDLLTQVFKPYIRRIRNGMYRFRFHSGFEQELRYISHVFELESASYNFSLNSMKHVKQFFNDALANTSEKETGVISRTHIILGDMCAIEQSYNLASEHYSIAARVLRNVLLESTSAVNHENLMNYIEVLLKQGDLSEHRQNYGRAAALYSEAESIVKKYVTDLHLSNRLQDGDSKWDLLKQPFWADKYLSLKRSPRPFKGDLDEIKLPDRPDYLYRDSDPRFYNYAACFFFFMGDAKSAVHTYNITLGLTKLNTGLLDERASYLHNFAKVGVVESTLIYHARKLFRCYLSSQGNSNEKIKATLIKLLELIIKEEVLSSDNLPDQEIKKISDMLRTAAEDYEDNRLYISTVITCIKTICYFTTLLDSFDNCTFVNPSKESEELKELVNKTSCLIYEMGVKAARCIDKARQLESSQSAKTLMVYDFNESEPKDITKLIDWFLETGKKYGLTVNENASWQQSLWTHKLASTLMWFKFVKDKLLVEETAYKLPDLSFISVRPAVLVRWIHARYELNKLIEKIYQQKEDRCCVNEILRKIKIKETESILIGSVSACRFTTTNIIFYCNEYEDSILEEAYKISRYLYFSLHKSRIISRKNIDLIFPRLSQIYHIQWKLLTNLMAAVLVRVSKESSSETISRFSSIRDIAFLLQKRFIRLDEKLAPHDRIPPSYFDYEYIYLRLEESLDSSANLVDRTSRSHMSIFQHKYFCHDDHNDQEFHMDYTLAYMFTPMALYFRDQIKETHENFVNVIKNLNV